ncbi:aromatic ring-hydroxylating oxygenase subunit alpha [Sediminicola luteus]|uniref:Rieske domain-containing protein n=1 Tax=Sediminicola luteus TaxID=319238 RepID=A0A2A4GC52_9FLAO|nr:aromatic ring-hydroxylating dioxygenase subunit alpha [Sediminicola luteus]PCE66033.1 hypothetical protein B7P33_01655 [Sediminicola luteus]
MEQDTRLMPVLPIEAYTSEAWFEKEKEMVFGRVWNFAGFVEDLANPGDYVTVQVGNDNIMVVKGRDNRLRAFHNICRHRGTQLLRAVGKQQTAITCPYHNWVYNLTGELVSVPDEKTQFPNLDKKKFCLHKASVDIFRGMVFVHKDENPEQSLSDYFEGVMPYLSPVHKPLQLVEAKDFIIDEEVACNWKILVENFMDVYHLKQLHSKTLFMFDHDNAEFCYVGPHYMFKEPVVETDFNKRLAYQPLLPIKNAKKEAYVPMLFPNCGLAEGFNSWSVFHVIPLAPDRSRLVVRSKVEPQGLVDQIKLLPRYVNAYFAGQKMKKLAKNPDPMETYDFVAEDNYACEQQQKAIKSAKFSVGISAKHTEAQVRNYQQIVKDYMEGYPEKHQGLNTLEHI